MENIEHVERLAGILGCGVSSLPMKYLGLPLGVSYKAKHIWNGVIEKIEYWLASWKMIYLSKGGRVALINGTLSNLPKYQLIHSKRLITLFPFISFLKEVHILMLCTRECLTLLIIC